LFFIYYLDSFTIIRRSRDLNWDVDDFIFICCWLILNSKNKIFYVFPHFVEFLFILNFVQTELFSFTFAFLHNQLISDFFVLRTRIEFFDRGEWYTTIVFKSTYFLFFLNAAFLIVNKRVINVVIVDFWISLLAFFDYFAWPIYIPLFHYLFIKIVSYWIKSWSFDFRSLVVVQWL